MTNPASRTSTSPVLVAVRGPHVIYVPGADEDPADLHARLPVTEAFVLIEGDAAAPVRDIRFENVHFEYAEFAVAPPANPPFGSARTLAAGARVRLRGAGSEPGARRDPAASHPRLRVRRRCHPHVGGYALELGEGTRGALVSGARFEDLGAGGVRMGGPTSRHRPLAPATTRSATARW